MKRTIVGVLAAIVTLFLAATLAPAQAAAPDGVSEAALKSTTADSRAAAPLPVRKFINPAVVKRNGQPYYVARIEGPYRNAKVIMKVKTCKTCAFKLYKTVWTDSKSKINVKLYYPAKLGQHRYFRPVVPKSGRFGVSRGPIAITCTVRAGQQCNK